MARSPYRAFAGIFAATLFTLMAVGAVLPVLPHYVKGPLNYGSLAVGFAIGAFAFTGPRESPDRGPYRGFARPPARRRGRGGCSRRWRAASTSSRRASRG